VVDTYSPGATRLLDAVAALRPALAATAERSERERRLPVDAVRALRESGVYRMFLPSELGGDPVDLETFVAVLETLAQGNAAAGWDVAAHSIMTLVAIALPAGGVERIYGGKTQVPLAGSLAGGRGRAAVDAAAGGYRVTGRWSFGSGSSEADWIGGSCDVFDGDEPRLGPNGLPQIAVAFFPREAVTIHDVWHTLGMRGTGSNDWSVNGAFVPEPLVVSIVTAPPWSGTLYRIPRTVVTALHFSAVAAGVARGAIDYLTELAQTKTAVFERRYSVQHSLLRERVQTQEAVARAEVLLESARAYRSRMIAEVWETAERGEPITVQQRARMRLAGTNLAECAIRVVDMMFQAAGTTAIDEMNPLARALRDVHVIAQNIAVYALNWEHGGRVLLGLDPGTPIW